MNETAINILIIVITILISVGIIGGVLSSYIYKKIHHQPTGECACCHKSKNKLIKEYHKKYSK